MTMTNRISIAAAGDIFANGRFYDGDQPISATFEDVLAATRSADVVFANYEMPLSTRGRPLEKRIRRSLRISDASVSRSQVWRTTT